MSDRGADVNFLLLSEDSSAKWPAIQKALVNEATDAS